MIAWNQFSDLQILVFGLLMIRMATFIFSSSIFGSPILNPTLKILFATTLALVLFPTLDWKNIQSEAVSTELIGFAAREAFLGLLLGFLTRIFFFIVNMVGDLVSILIGLNTAQLYNPLMGSQGNTMDQIYTGLGTLLFLALQGHHIWLSGITESLQVLPVAGATLKLGGLFDVVFLFQSLMIAVIKMSAPVLVTIFLVNLSMGILGRAVPQVNVLVTSMPIAILLGMMVVFLSLPMLIGEMSGLIDFNADTLFKLMRSM